MIGVALDGDRGADSFDDHLVNVDDPITSTDSGLDAVAHLHRRRGLGGFTVDLHVPTPARGSSVAAGLGEPNRPQPLIDTPRIHASTLRSRPDAAMAESRVAGQSHHRTAAI